MFKNEMAMYESPSLVELQVAAEGVLCQSGTEKLGENEGFWA